MVTAAIGDLIAVAHADDLSFPDRLERQVATVTARPEAVLVGAPAVGIDAAGRSIHPANLWRITHPSAFAPFTMEEIRPQGGGRHASASVSSSPSSI